jgi:hypothetical protein
MEQQQHVAAEPNKHSPEIDQTMMACWRCLSLSWELAARKLWWLSPPTGLSTPGCLLGRGGVLQGFGSLHLGE